MTTVIFHDVETSGYVEGNRLCVFLSFYYLLSNNKRRLASDFIHVSHKPITERTHTHSSTEQTKLFSQAANWNGIDIITNSQDSSVNRQWMEHLSSTTTRSAENHYESLQIQRLIFLKNFQARTSRERRRGRVWGGVSPPQSTRGSGEHHELSSDSFALLR